MDFLNLQLYLHFKFDSVMLYQNTVISWHLILENYLYLQKHLLFYFTKRITRYQKASLVPLARLQHLQNFLNALRASCYCFLQMNLELGSGSWNCQFHALSIYFVQLVSVALVEGVLCDLFRFIVMEDLVSQLIHLFKDLLVSHLLRRKDFQDLTQQGLTVTELVHWAQFAS